MKDKKQTQKRKESNARNKKTTIGASTHRGKPYRGQGR